MSRTTSILIIIGICAAAMLLIYAIGKQRTRQMNELLNCLGQGNFEKFEDLIRQKQATNCLNPFDRDYLMLTAAIMTDSSEQIHTGFDELSSKRLTVKQRYLVCVRTMGWCIASKDSLYCTKCIDMLNNLPGYEKTKEYAGMIYRIVVEKGTTDLPVLLQQVSNQQGSQKTMTEYLIAAVYDNEGQHKLSRQYSDMARTDSKKAIDGNGTADNGR